MLVERGMRLSRVIRIANKERATCWSSVDAGAQYRGGGRGLRHRVELSAAKRGAAGLTTSEALLAIIVQLFHGGEANKLKLANKAIAIFEFEEEYAYAAGFDASGDRPHHADL